MLTATKRAGELTRRDTLAIAGDNPARIDSLAILSRGKIQTVIVKLVDLRILRAYGKNCGRSSTPGRRSPDARSASRPASPKMADGA